MLILTRKKNEVITIGDDIEIIVSSIDDNQVRIGIKAPSNVKIYRKEVLDEIKKQNQASIVDVDAIKNVINIKK